MKLAWLTDLHLDHVDDAAIDVFWKRVSAAPTDAVLITGDIATSVTIEQQLRRAASIVARPVYFVLGNHDFYDSSIQQVRAQIRALADDVPTLTWMTAATVVPLDPRTALVGHDAWADARLGDPLTSPVQLTDWFAIDELRVPRDARIAKLRELGDEAAAHLREHVAAALTRFERVIVLMHPAPIRKACRYWGLVSPDFWLPHLVCAAAGEVLLELARANPHRSILVLAGHTHGRARERPLPNLEIRVGSAEYKKPAMQRMVETPTGPT
jgi:predicted phosphohydrolase